ncbi:MAG TPA: hypothetical protein PLG16_06640 [Planctomycetota bacterium]|nr:hypothetical protein [Planctomycetota bacterium]
MGDWTFMFFKVMLIPIIAMVVGLQGIYKPPSQDSLDRGLLYTPKMNDEKWNASCKHYGKLLWIAGRILFIFSPLPMLCICWCDANTVKIVGDCLIAIQVFFISVVLLYGDISWKKISKNWKNGNRSATIYRDKI